MRHPYSSGYPFWVFVSDIVALLLLGWAVFSVGNWLGWTYPPGCYLGWSLAALLRSAVLDGVAMICLLVWMLTLGRKAEALIWAIVLTAAVGWATGKVPELLATC